MQKTLGGDRLGSGKKMKVDLHGYERATFDLSYIWRSTMSSGTLVPFMSEVALPGDTFDIDLECDMKTHPTIGPLFGSWKVQLDIFQAPIRLYNSLLHNNALEIGMNMTQVKLPVMQFEVPEWNGEDYEQIDQSTILAYLGIRGLGKAEQAETLRTFNAVPWLAYWEIYKNYYANKQEEKGAVIHRAIPAPINRTVDRIVISMVGEIAGPSEPQEIQQLVDGLAIEVQWINPAPNMNDIMLRKLDGTLITLIEVLGYNYTTVGQTYQGTVTGRGAGGVVITNWQYRSVFDPLDNKPEVTMFPLRNIDTMREIILGVNSRVAPFTINAGIAIAPYQYLFLNDGEYRSVKSTQEGLAVKTYQSDMFNNWLKTEWIDGPEGISAVTAISTVGDSFTLDTLNLSKKVYDMLNRIAVSGGSYDDWLDAVYAHDRYKRAESPMYMGGLIKELVFQEVVSNSASEEQPLGTLAGRGTLSRKNKGGHVVIKVDEPSYIIGIISLTPRVDYSQGNNWDIHLQTLDDLHKPALDQIGFQDLITEQQAWWTTNWNDTNQKWEQKATGKQPAWINYMTNVNKTYGNFAVPDNEMFMTLNRRYEMDSAGNIKDLTTYIDPVKFNFIFADTRIDAMNFWAQIGVNITARRKMSAKVMPNL